MYLDPDLCDLKTQRDQLPGNIIAPLLVIILQLIIIWNGTQPYIESNHHKWNYSFATRSSFSSICGIVSCWNGTLKPQWTPGLSGINIRILLYHMKWLDVNLKLVTIVLWVVFSLYVIEFIGIFWLQWQTWWVLALT